MTYINQIIININLIVWKFQLNCLKSKKIKLSAFIKNNNINVCEQKILNEI